MMKVVAGLILLMMAGTWSYLSIEAGYIMEISDKFLWACGILFTGNVGEIAAKNWKGKKDV